MDLTGKQVLVAGLGKSGIAAGALLKKMGCMVCLFDGNEKFDRSAWEKTYPVFSDCPLWIGELPDAAVQEMELAVVSPGIPLDTPVILKLQAAGVPVVGEAELAYRFEKGRVAAITGTNGKTTTTTLVGEILKKCYPEVFVAGNIGIPYTSIVGKTTEQTVTVTEISSFQLETMETFHPSVSAILNITPDHLDRHHTMEAYIRAKESITKCQTKEDTCVLNYEDEILRKFAETLKVNVLFFSSKRPLEEGIYLQENTIWIAGKETERQRLIDVGELKLLGIHNYENVMAASGTALCMGAPIDVVQRVLKEFWGVKHRIEFVRDLQGVLPESYREVDFRQLYLLREKYPNIYKHVEERLETGWETTISLLEQGMKEGVIRPVKIPIVKMMLEAALEQFFQRDILISNGISYQDGLDEVVTILVQGIVAEGT